MNKTSEFIKKSALLIVDIQVGAFDGELIPPVLNSEAFLRSVESLLSKARMADITVIYIQDCGEVGGAFEENSRQWQIHPKISPQNSDLIFKKRGPDAYSEANLLKTLQAKKINHIYACGLHSESCFLTTCKQTLSHGLSLTVISDGHRCKAQEEAKAKETISSINNLLKDLGASLKNSDKILEELDSRIRPTIRLAVPGDEAGIHKAHMRSIREVCIKDHGEEEIKGWGYRPLGDRWIESIKNGFVWVIEFNGTIYGNAYIKINGGHTAHLHSLYLTPEVLKQGFGHRLMELMLNKAKEHEVKKITLDSSITAHEFYKKYNFVDVGPKTKRVIGGHPVSSYPMELQL